MGLVVLLALGGVAVTQFAETAATARQREREAELLWVGQQYRQAIESYYRASPGLNKHLPVSFDELLRDPRFPQPVRHLRRLYPDPMQPEAPWGLLRRGSQCRNPPDYWPPRSSMKFRPAFQGFPRKLRATAQRYLRRGQPMTA